MQRGRPSAKGLHQLRSLEALCGAIAALTLTAPGIPAERLTSAIGAVQEFNRSRFGIAANDADYPSLRERQAIVERFSAVRTTAGGIHVDRGRRI